MHLSPVLIVFLIAFFVVPQVLRAMRGGATAVRTTAGTPSSSASDRDDDDDDDRAGDDGSEITERLRRAQRERDAQQVARAIARAGGVATTASAATVAALEAAVLDAGVVPTRTAPVLARPRPPGRASTGPAAVAGSGFGPRPPLDPRAPLAARAPSSALACRAPQTPVAPVSG